MSFYKKDSNGNWWEAKEVHLPTGEVLNEENKLELNGWKWNDDPAKEYIEWKASIHELEA